MVVWVSEDGRILLFNRDVTIHIDGKDGKELTDERN